MAARRTILAVVAATILVVACQASAPPTSSVAVPSAAPVATATAAAAAPASSAATPTSAAAPSAAPPGTPASTPAATPAPTPAPTPTTTPAPTPAPTPAATSAPTPAPTASPTAPPTPAPTPAPTRTLKPGETPRPTPIDLSAYLTATLAAVNDGSAAATVEVILVDTSSGQQQSAGKIAYAPLDATSENVPEGDYRIQIARAGAKKPDVCDVHLAKGDTVTFAIFDDRVLVAKPETPVTTLADLVVPTSPICRGA